MRKALSPATSAYWLRVGYALHEEGDLSGAEHAYRRTILFDDRDARAWFNLGNVLCDLERPGDAIEAYRVSIALTPEDHEAWNNLGVASCENGAPRESIRCFENAITLEPGYHAAWANLGCSFEALGDSDGDCGGLALAVTAYRKAIALQDHRARYHLNLASALCRLDRRGEGARHLADALAIDPGLSGVVAAFPEFDGLGEVDDAPRK